MRVRTRHVETKDNARGILTPDQSSSMLLIAKAQYKVRKSDSLLPGTVEKLYIYINKRMISKGDDKRERERGTTFRLLADKNART